MGLNDFFQQIATGIGSFGQGVYNFLNKNIRDPVLSGIKQIPLLGGLVGGIADPIIKFTDKGVNMFANTLQGKL